MRWRGRLAVAAVLLAIPLAMAGMVPAAATGDGRTILPGTDAAPFRSIAIDQGPTPADTPVRIQVYLNVNDPHALESSAQRVSDPKSPGYRRYESAAQISSRYRLNPAQVGSVTGWLQSAGLTVSQPNWRWLAATGTVGQLETAFGVQYDNYTFTDGPFSATGFLVTANLSVPDDIASLVEGAIGATYSEQITRSSTTTTRDSAAAGNNSSTAGAQEVPVSVTDPAGRPLTLPLANPAAASPAPKSSADNAQCSQYWGQQPATGLPPVNGATPPYTVCGYTPTQLRAAYGFDNSSVTGKGQTVAVITPPSATLEEDVDTWSAQVGTPALRPGQLTVIGSPDGSSQPVPGPSAGAVENTLDVEAIHGMAPDANIVAMGLSTQEGATLLDSFAYVEDHNLASIVSASLGLAVASPGMKAAYDEVFQEGALQGIGFDVATGDSGTYSYPASSSWVTGVGGTSLGIGQHGQRLFETGWADVNDTLSADGKSWVGPVQDAGDAGGGRVDGQPQPWYQRGVVPTHLAEDSAGELDRTGADVAMDADLATGILTGGHPLDVANNGATYTSTVVGGTSLATPLFAAVQALAQQVSGVRIGFANPEIYARYQTSSFRDITAYQNPDGTYPTGVLTVNPILGNTSSYLFTLQGHGVPEADLPDPLQTLPGFDEVTGVGVPTVSYLHSFGSPGRGGSR